MNNESSQTTQLSQQTVQSKPFKQSTCIVCGKQSADGINIWHNFICRPCEGEMVGTQVQDEKYHYFVKKMRKIWLKENA